MSTAQLATGGMAGGPEHAGKPAVRRVKPRAAAPGEGATREATQLPWGSAGTKPNESPG